MRSLRVEGESRPVERRGLECTRLREGEKLVLVGVFEAKAGPHPSVEPTRSTSTVIKLPLRAGCPDRAGLCPTSQGGVLRIHRFHGVSRCQQREGLLPVLYRLEQPEGEEEGQQRRLDQE